MERLKLICVLILLGNAACRQGISNTKNPELDKIVGPADLYNYQSERYFRMAEHCLHLNQRSDAREYLHSGIVAYRSETGRYRGQDAIEANHAIDALTRLRRQIGAGKSIDPEGLHLAIAAALDLEPEHIPRRPTIKTSVRTVAGGH